MYECVCLRACIFLIGGFGFTCFRNTAVYTNILKALNYLAVNHLFDSFIPAFFKCKHYMHRHTQANLTYIYWQVTRHDCLKKLKPGVNIGLYDLRSPSVSSTLWFSELGDKQVRASGLLPARTCWVKAHGEAEELPACRALGNLDFSLPFSFYC